MKPLKPISASAHSADDIPNAPRCNGRDLWGYAPACCRRLHESVPSSTLAVRRLYVTKDGSPTHRPALQWSFHTTPHARGRLQRQGRLRPCRRVLSLPVSGHRPVKPSRGDAESAMSPFGSGRPVRPCVVVNPGGGWASWPQPSSENNFPCAARIPRGTNSFRFQVLHVVATAARCGQPIPRRTDHNKDALARPCSTRKEKSSWLTSAPSPQRKTASPASSAP